MQASSVRAVLYARDLKIVTAFYRTALGMTASSGDEHHSVLDCGGFTLIVHRIPQHIVAELGPNTPPQRRSSAAIRLDYPVPNILESRRAARALGGDIDDRPPGWANPGANFFLGHDPEGNPFGVSERPA